MYDLQLTTCNEKYFHFQREEEFLATEVINLLRDNEWLRVPGHTSHYIRTSSVVEFKIAKIND